MADKEEIVSLASSFESKADPFEVEQEPVYDFDTTKVLGRNKYGGALLRSKWSDEDNAIDAARKAAGFVMPSGNIKTSDRLGDMAAVSYSEGKTFDTSEEALSDLPSYLSRLTEERAATDEEFNTRNYDPSEFAMSGVSAKNGVSSRAATDATASYINNNNIPLSIEVDGQTRYLTTGLGSDVYTKADEDFDYQAGSYEDMGAVGTYSTIHVKPKSVLDNPVLNVLAMAIPYGQAILAVTKGLAGETLKLGDYVSIAAAGLSYKGTLEGKTLAEAEQFATQTVDQAIDAAAKSGDAMTAAQATQLYNKTMAAVETAPSVLGVTLSDVVDLKSGKIEFSDILDNVVGGSFKELEAASKAAQASNVPDGVIVNLLSDSVAALDSGTPLGVAVDVFNTARDVYLEQVEDTNASEAERAAKIETFKALNDDANVTITDINDEQVDITGVTPDMPESSINEDYGIPVFDTEEIVADPFPPQETDVAAALEAEAAEAAEAQAEAQAEADAVAQDIAARAQADAEAREAAATREALAIEQARIEAQVASEAEAAARNAEAAARNAAAEQEAAEQAEAAEQEKQVYADEHPWIYEGNGSFRHGTTGEVILETVGDDDPYNVGEGYSGPESTETSDTDAETVVETIDDIFNNTIDPPTNPIGTIDPPTNPVGTTDTTGTPTPVEGNIDPPTSTVTNDYIIETREPDDNTTGTPTPFEGNIDPPTSTVTNDYIIETREPNGDDGGGGTTDTTGTPDPDDGGGGGDAREFTPEIYKDPERTTKSLFADMLQFDTQVNNTQQVLQFQPRRTREDRPVGRREGTPIRSFLNDLKQQQASSARQGMLTNPQTTKRLPY